MPAEPTASTKPTEPTSSGRKRGRGADPEQTKNELIDAATQSLLEEGYSGTTARSIAARADCNQAAIYYHFGGIDALLVKALERSSADRLERYQSSVTVGESLAELVERLHELYSEDRDAGHFAVLAELAGGVTASPELAVGIAGATEPWLEFIEQRIREAASTLSFGSMLPAADMADLVLSVVIGIELRNRVDGRDDRADRVFRLGRLLAALAQSQGVTTSK